MKNANVCFLRKGEKEVLLGMKKRGFGVGKWNGMGGKEEPGETKEEAAIREIYHETTVRVRLEDLEYLGEVEFRFKSKPDWDQRVSIFVVRKWTGEIVETEEMRPQWFAISDIPYDQMWWDDHLWMPKILAGKRISALFEFNEDGETVANYEIKEV